MRREKRLRDISRRTPKIALVEAAPPQHRADFPPMRWPGGHWRLAALPVTAGHCSWLAS